ncbi:aspartate carbamoyltransferase catalytic subunit [Caldalkalibacillus uzonensis]|uniref:Aspartate carbamoyltransferase n=1 Tax=Caldalkalibacillus uzonensis TaxID=353224 RepID=A0ABU0CMD1_9BACI|nr:aspartate carbamoyltransferase catalytic subunit [Caldalkalibacillus uzonensis]
MNHLTGIQHLDSSQLNMLLDTAQRMKESGEDYAGSLEGQCVANLFFEPSTRTRFSFEVAEKRLGAHVLNFQESASSRQKGESMYDTLKTLAAIGVKAAVIRHSQNGLMDDLQERTGLALINAGTGNEEHPTQCLLDLLTIKQEFGCLRGLKVAIVGDIHHSRVARSNYYGLTKLGAKVYFAGPACLNQTGAGWVPRGCWYDFDELLEEMDVIMMLRIQHERHEQTLAMSKDEYHQQYGLTEERARRMKRGAIIMHPAPVNRDVELASTLVEAPQSRIFKQMENGVYVRMAVLYHLLCPAAQRQEQPVNKGGERHGTFVKAGLYA